MGVFGFCNWSETRERSTMEMLAVEKLANLLDPPNLVKFSSAPKIPDIRYMLYIENFENLLLPDQWLEMNYVSPR